MCEFYGCSINLKVLTVGVLQIFTNYFHYMNAFSMHFQSHAVSLGGNLLENKNLCYEKRISIDIPDFDFSKLRKFHGNIRAFAMWIYIPVSSQRKGFTAFLFILCQTHSTHMHTLLLSHFSSSDLLLQMHTLTNF